MYLSDLGENLSRCEESFKT